MPPSPPSPSATSTTISSKLTGIVMLICASVILLTLVVTIITQGIYLRNSMIDKISTLAKIIGKTSTESLILKRKYLATPILATLKTEPTIQVAYIFDSKNSVFAHYFNDNSTTLVNALRLPYFDQHKLHQAIKQKKIIYYFTSKSFCLYSPIINNNKHIGSIYLQSGLNTIITNLLMFVVTALIMLAVAIALGYWLISRLQPSITGPLHNLVERMRITTSDKTYQEQDKPVEHNNIIEIAELEAGFDEMLEQINKRQQELQQHSQLLEEQVLKRTLDLQQSNTELRNTITELEQARHEAIEASAAKSRFLANMSHEIRTPMVGVLGMAELLLKKSSDNYQRELTSTILSAGQSLLTILNDFLDISKIEAGKVELERRPFDPVTLLENSVELLTDNAFNKGLELTTVPSPYLPDQIVGDAGRLRQIILNLLSNAIKFTEEGRVSIFMTSKPLENGYAQLNIDVCDSGIGIEDKVKEQIFTAFSQADISTTRTYGGTGLGLTIVKQLVELMDGTITVHDRQPRGSCFSVKIPFPTRENSTVNRRLKTEIGVTKALIATSNPDLAQLLTQHLSALGITSETIGSAYAMQHKLQDAPYRTDMIFMDIAMPDTGVDLLIKQRKKTRNEKLVLIAQRLYKPNVSRQHELGIDHFLIKPVKVRNLLHIFATSEHDDEGETTHPDNTQVHSDKKAHILLAEDNPTNQRLVQLILEQTDYKLTIVGNGKLAVEATNNGHFDLILMDCQMPVMDGYEAARIISASGNHTPIIALTAHASDENIARCLKSGMQAYMCKPFRQQQLLQTVKDILGAMPTTGEK